MRFFSGLELNFAGLRLSRTDLAYPWSGDPCRLFSFPSVCSLFFPISFVILFYPQFSFIFPLPELFLMSCCLTDNQSCQFGDFATKLRDLLIVAATFINVLSKGVILVIFDVFFFGFFYKNK